MPDGRLRPSQEELHVGHRHCCVDQASPARRSRRHHAHPPRGDDQERHRPAGHRQGEAAGGHGPRRRPGAFDNDGKRIAIDVKKGDKVLYAKYAGTEFKVDGDELLIVSQKDILAIVED